jgi:hypothetical protein
MTSPILDAAARVTRLRDDSSDSAADAEAHLRAILNDRAPVLIAGAVRSVGQRLTANSDGGDAWRDLVELMTLPTPDDLSAACTGSFNAEQYAHRCVRRSPRTAALGTIEQVTGAADNWAADMEHLYSVSHNRDVILTYDGDIRSMYTQAARSNGVDIDADILHSSLLSSYWVIAIVADMLTHPDRPDGVAVIPAVTTLRSPSRSIYHPCCHTTAGQRAVDVSDLTDVALDTALNLCADGATIWDAVTTACSLYPSPV